MGMLVDGAWTDDDGRRQGSDGSFVRAQSGFREAVTADGSSGFPAAAGRYHLYVNLGCPWAYRTVLMRKLKGLEDVVSMSLTRPGMGPEGWQFGDDGDTGPDPLLGAKHLHEIYTAARPDCTARVTVPVLWDRERRTIVNNESSEIIRMLNSEFDAFTADRTDYYPEDLRDEIDEINAFVYERINNGVYRCGFAGTQEAYETAFELLFGALDTLEERLGEQRYLVGDRITEADWRLFATLVRFDVAYYGRFNCNRQRLVDFANLWAYTRELYQVPGVAQTVDFEHIKRIYFTGHRRGRIVPRGPSLDFAAPPGRG
jgi:putative glutathione S-transferase